MQLRVLNGLPEPGSTPGGKRSCGGQGACSVCAQGDKIENDPLREYWPSHVILEITNRCNLDCIMCERRFVTPDDLMSRAVFDACAERFIPHSVCTELSGLGEPTLAPDFPYMAGRVYEAGKALYFPTNGAGLVKPSVLASLVDSGDTRVSFSLDAATPETYGHVRVQKGGKPGDWEAAVVSLKTFRAARPNAWLGSCYVAGAYNVDEFPAFVKLAAEWGLNEVTFKPVRCWGLKPHEVSLRYYRTRTEDAIHRAEVAAFANGVRLTVERPQYADGFEDAGSNGGFISYFDVLPMGLFECGTGSTTDSGSGTGGSPSLTSSAVISGASFGDSDIMFEDVGFVVRSPKAQRPSPKDREGKEIVRTSDVMQILTDGSVTTCGAKHLIGHVKHDTFLDIVADPSYQSHLFARACNRADLSRFCASCAKMM